MAKGISLRISVQFVSNRDTNDPASTRRQSHFALGLREILSDLQEKWASAGEPQFMVAVPRYLADVPGQCVVAPISQNGNGAEILGKLGGTDQLRSAVNQLQSLLYRD